MGDHYGEFLRQVYFFKKLGDAEIGLIGSLCHEESFGPGEVVFREGARADKFFMVIEGSVEVWKNFEGGRGELLALHGNGHLFGEMALIDELPRSATVRARDRVRTLAIYREDFQGLLLKNNRVALAIMRSISLMIRASNELFVEDLRQRNIELERAYAELKRAQDELVRNERLSTLGKFSSLIIHDLKNPLSALGTQAQLILMSKDSPELVEKCGQSLVREVGRLERLTMELLDYSRGEIRLSYSPCRIDHLFDKLIDNVADRFAQRRISIDKRVEFQGPMIIDEERMFRVFLNLADNARKAMMDSGGILSLTASPVGENVLITVRDTGEGMSRDVLSHIYEPFYSSSKQGGTGLGMLIVKNIVEAHAGNIDIDSHPGKGTSIRINLPVKP